MARKQVIRHTEHSEVEERVAPDGGVERTEHRSYETYVERSSESERQGGALGLLRKMRWAGVWSLIAKLWSLFMALIF